MGRFLFAIAFLISSYANGSVRTLNSTFIRTHILVAPDIKPKTPRPLVVLLHGCKMDAQDILDISEIEKYIDARNFTVLAPSQSRLNNLDRCWNFFEKANQRPVGKGAGFELAGLAEMIQKTIEESDGSIDPSRIYIAGISSGAAMALNLFLCDSVPYAGLAMHSGIAFGVADTSNAEKLLLEGSGLSQAELHNKLKQCPKNTDSSKVIAVHGDKDERVAMPNFLDLKSQLTRTCTSKLLPDRNRKFHLIPGLGHQWSGSQFPHRFASQEGPPFTEAFLRHFNIK